MDLASRELERRGDLGFALVLPIGEEHHTALFRCERRDGAQQVDVGANFGSCFGANSDEVALPLPATLPPQVERLVSDRCASDTGQGARSRSKSRCALSA